MMMYMAKTYGLDPLLKQIWAIKRNERDPALIMVGRDGMLAIAHRSGKFDGMQSSIEYEDDGKTPKIARCEVWRKDMSHSFKTEILFAEYNTGHAVWKSHPSAMGIKVAESVTLRKAFSVSGVYDPDEINTGA
jgi:phage recombination protein Bet